MAPFEFVEKARQTAPRPRGQEERLRWRCEGPGVDQGVSSNF